MNNLTQNLKEFYTGEDVKGKAWHWFDFTCPFCYVSKSRNKILEENGFNIIALPFQAHPEVPVGGIFMGQRQGPMYDLLEEEARAADLSLKWPLRLPNSRYALAAAEQVRRHSPGHFQKVEDRLFAAHFALGEDLGSKDVVHNCLKESGIAESEISSWMKGDAAYEAVKASEIAAVNCGVRGTPAWVVNEKLISGLQSREYFDSFKPDLD